MAFTAEQTAYRQQLLEDREQRFAPLDATPGGWCYCCGGFGGRQMAPYHVEPVLWVLQREQEAEYDRYPWYRRTDRIRDDAIYAPCSTCNRQRIIPDGYKRLTMEQARLWALRQRRLERRQTKGVA